MANSLMNRDFGMFDPMDIFSDFDHGFMKESQMKTDVRETDKTYEVASELPGFKKEDIHLDYRDNTLRISAVHNLQKDEKDKKGQLLRQERSSSNVVRSFYLPGVDKDNVSAKYDGGILTISLPKVDGQVEDDHHIEIN